MNHLLKKIAIVAGVALSLTPFSGQADNLTIIPEVNLSPKKWQLDPQQLTMQTTQFNRQQIATSPVFNLNELLQQQQSIIRLTNNSGDNSQTALSIRGFGDNAAANTLILIDGFPLLNPSLLAPNFNAIPLADIQRIDIFQGSEGSLWGDQAVGGVVSITTRHPRPGKPLGNVTASVGNFNEVGANLLGGNEFQHGWFLKAFGNASRTSHYRYHNQQSNNNLAAQIGNIYTSGTISLYAQTYETNTELPGGLSATQFFSNPRQATNFLNNGDYETQILQLLSQQNLGDHWLLETRLSHNDTRGNGYVYANFSNDNAYNRLSPRLLGTFDHLRLTLGYDGQQNDYSLAQRQVNSRASSTQQNVYVQAMVPIQQVDLTLGARDAIQDNDIETILNHPVYQTDRVFVTEQGLTWHATPIWSFFLRRDGNFSFPKANEETLLPSQMQALAVQTGTSYETGTNWQTEHTHWQINLYHLILHNEIAFDPVETPAQPFGAYSNLDQTVRNGITLTQSYLLTSEVTVDSQINYVNARFASGPDSGHVIPAVPAFTGNIGLQYAFTSHWQGRYMATYNGSQFASNDVSNTGRPVAGYWLNTIAIQYLMPHVNLSFEIDNLFNQLYSAYTYYDINTQTNTYYPGAGRRYLLTCQWDLD